MTDAGYPCPECGNALKARAKKCMCGWSKAPPPGSAPSANTVTVDDSRPSGDPNHFRCPWESNGERCRYTASTSNEQGPQARFFCFGHAQCWDTGDGALGQRIVEESMRVIPDGGDYSASGMLAGARKASVDEMRSSLDRQHRGVSGLAQVPRQQSASKFLSIGAAAAPKLPRVPDHERDSERAAIQDEGQ
jgi:hypothetical protein